MRGPTPATEPLRDRITQQVQIPLSHKKNLQMRGAAVTGASGSQTFAPPPLPCLTSRPRRPSPRRLGLVLGEGEPLGVVRVEIGAAVLPLDLVIEDQPLATLRPALGLGIVGI